LDGRNGHFVFTRRQFIRPNTGARFGSDSEKFGVGVQISRGAVGIGNTGHGTTH